MNVDDVIATADTPANNGGYSVQELLTNWCAVGRMADLLLSDATLPSMERQGLEECRAGAVKVVADLYELGCPTQSTS